MEPLLAAIDRAKARGLEVWTAGGARGSEVERLEAELGCHLPEAFRAFLMRVGALSLGDTHISGIVDGNALDLGGSSLYGDTVRARRERGLPGQLLIIQMDEDAPYCLDASSNVGGEMAVVCFEWHSQSAKRIANSFDEWVREFLG